MVIASCVLILFGCFFYTLAGGRAVFQSFATSSAIKYPFYVVKYLFFIMLSY